VRKSFKLSKLLPARSADRTSERDEGPARERAERGSHVVHLRGTPFSPGLQESQVSLPQASLIFGKFSHILCTSCRLSANFVKFSEFGGTPTANGVQLGS